MHLRGLLRETVSARIQDRQYRELTLPAAVYNTNRALSNPHRCTGFIRADADRTKYDINSKKGMEQSANTLETVRNPPLDRNLPTCSRHRFEYHITTRADGSPLYIPVTVIRGCETGPLLSCVAGIHGNEYEGVTALIELWDKIDPTQFAGTLLFVPVANPPAFASAARKSPVDDVDMNRIFPGDQTGTVTEQLASALLRDIIGPPDLLLSMHSFTSDAMVVPYTEYPVDCDVTDASRAAARAFGLQYVEPFDWPDGMLTAVASQNGTPAIEPEIGGLGCTLPERKALYKQGVQNLMAHLGMTDETQTPSTTVEQVDRHVLTTTHGGVLLRQKELHDDVVAGEMVATVTDLTGNPVEELVAPTDGFIAVQRQRAVISPGEVAAIVFTPMATERDFE